MASEQERAARNRLIDETRKATEKLIREFRKASKVAARTEAEQEREWKLAKYAQGIERELADVQREAEKFKAYSRQADTEIAQLRAELARLTTPRPIAEAPRESGKQIIALWMHGDVIESMDVVCWADMDMDGDHPERKFWMNTAGDSVEHMTHFLPLSAEGGQR